MFLGLPALHVVILPRSALDYDIYPLLFLVYFAVCCHLLYWFLLVFSLFNLTSTSSLTCPSLLLHY